MSRTKIDFFCVGPQRTASTWLQFMFAGHSELALPCQVKETMYFDKHFDKGEDWYLWHYRNALPSQKLGEVGPTYFDDDDARGRIQSHNQDAKIVIAVRNPMVRCHSLFRHHLSKGRVPNNFRQAIDRMPRILTSGKYQTHALNWEDSFPHRVHYITQQEIRTEPRLAVDSICSFLGVGPLEQLPDQANQRVNSASSPRLKWLARLLSQSATLMRGLRLHTIVEWGKSMGLKGAFRGGAKVDPLNAETYQFLVDYYEADIRWLEQRLDRDFSDWMHFDTTDMD